MSRLSDIEDSLIDDRTKGIPGGITPLRLRDIGGQHWNVLREDLPLPIGAVMAPHGKTTMSPQLFQRQLDNGAWAITVATVDQLQICRHYGFNRVVLANQLVGRQAIRYVLDELHADRSFEFYCLVDSVEGVDALADAARAHPTERPLRVLLEGGLTGGRTGCRSLESALTVGRVVKAASPHLALHGVEGFEGLIHADTDEEQEAKVGAFIDFLSDIALACDGEGLFCEDPIILSAGGSAFYDVAVERFGQLELNREIIVLTRSGCYLTHDSAMYRRFFARLQRRTPAVDELNDGLRPALEIWAYVQSRPEREKLILTMGKRDVSYDADMPVPQLWFRPGRDAKPERIAEACEVTGLNDQHTHMRVSANSPFEVGDMLAFGVSHPCTTFDKWQLIPVVDDDYTVQSAIKTFF